MKRICITFVMAILLNAVLNSCGDDPPGVASIDNVSFDPNPPVDGCDGASPCIYTTYAGSLNATDSGQDCFRRSRGDGILGSNNHLQS